MSEGDETLGPNNQATFASGSRATVIIQNSTIYNVAGTGQDHETTDTNREKRVAGKEKANQMKISLLREKAHNHFQNGDYEEAKTIAEELNSLQEFQELDILLLMTECDLYLARRSAGKSIDRLHDTILSCSDLKASDIKTLGDELMKNHRNVGSILLYWISSDKYKTEGTNPNDLIEYRQERATDIQAASEALAKSGGRSRIIITDYVIEFLIEMLDNISKATGTDADKKALTKGGCLISIVILCNQTEEYQKLNRFGSMGIEVFDNQFGANASNYRNYSFLLNNLGNGHRKSGRCEEAKPFYLKSIEAKKKATDFLDENERQKSIELTKNNLALTRVLHLKQKFFASNS